MLAENVPFYIAFGAGVLSFFSPCILPLIPAYILYLTGSNIDENTNNRVFALKRTLGFVIGFTIIFVIMGTTASFIGQAFARNRDIFIKIGGLIIIIFGLKMTGILNLKVLNIEKKSEGPKQIKSWFGAVLMGMAFAAGWTPCFGPILASILVFAGATGTVVKGMLLLLTYSLGMAIPFIITALFINAITKAIRKIEKVIRYMPQISGIIIIIFGLLIFFDKIKIISGLLI